MASNEYQARAMIDCHFVLEHYLEGQPVYVGIDLMIYYEKDNPAVSVAPDIFVC